jgi:hypothetical protein
MTIEPPNPSKGDSSDPAARADAWVDRASELPSPVGVAEGDGDAASGDEGASRLMPPADWTT